MKKTVIALLALVVVASACKKEENAEPVSTPQEQPFQYLKVGNKWVYNYYHNGNPLDSLITEVLSKNNDAYEIITADRAYKQYSFQYIEDGKLKQYIKGKTKQDAVTINDYNAKTGDTWAIKDRQGKDSIVYTVKTVDESVVVPLGTYTCKKIVAEYANGWVFTNYVNNKYGIIKIDMRTKNSTTTSVYELREINF
jgi:hypothetical protein